MSDGDTGRGGDRIASVGTAFRVLEAVRERDSVGVTELAEALDLPKSTVHHYLATLADGGYLAAEDGRYRLGLGLFTLGATARTGERLFHVAKPNVDRLAEATGEQARLVVVRDGRAITLYQATGDAVDDPPTYAGTVEDLHCTAAGKAYLAELPDERLDEFLADHPLPRRTANTVTDPDELRAALSAVRDRGVAFDDEERDEGVRCVASAVSDRSGELLGAISVSAPLDRMPDDRFRSEIPSRLRNVVGVVEFNTTYSEWSDAL
ncbi:transcriptional regulator, IclR family protein [Halosimplex carlsbadense 2-9-1]|uniref:Transcriptional regulator, IclR family protein n=1 Tax=Halosimplex carlsbadense 2-9-1 TaxID=797114 RepID=M0CUH7_9EURY|nr:IclR family transcriptional regulator [Halosimplex carlsbadense]ELZ26900.1 transcriptional regulator, IclR family protein [Halosimplex carlsbadense 2-9-1]